MKRFDKNFKNKLYEIIRKAEKESSVEIVTIVKAQSGKYTDISLFFGIFILFICYTAFMFVPKVFDPYLIYIVSLLSFFVGFAACELILPLKKIFLSKKRSAKNAEIYARAVFQKGGIRHTKDKIGVLFYISVFERKIVVLPDRGAEFMIPNEEMQKLQKVFGNIFNSPNVAQMFLEQLDKSISIFSEFIPIKENDINELPDDLEVDL